MAGRGTGRVLRGLIYAVLALAPVAFLAAAPETEDSDDVFVPVAIGFVARTGLALQVVIASRGPAFTAALVSVVGSEDDYGEWLHPLEAPLACRLGQAAVLLLVLLTVT